MKLICFLLFLLIHSIVASSNESENEPLANAVVEWVQSLGGAWHRSLAIKDVGSGRGRGVISFDSIDKGELLMRVPHSAMLSTENSALDADTMQWIQMLDEQISEERTNRMALLVLRACSPLLPRWAPLCNALPRLVATSTMYFTDEQLDMLESSPLADFERARRSRIADTFSRLAANDAIVAGVGDFSLERFQWALSMLWSRTISVRIDGEDGGALVPLADMFNGAGDEVHNDGPAVRVHMGDDALEYYAARPIQANEELTTEYGARSRQSNAELLFFYGFTDDANRLSRAALRLPIGERSCRESWKVDLLESIDLNRERFFVSNDGGGRELLAVARICTLPRRMLDRWREIVSSGEPVDIDHERAALHWLVDALDAELASYGAPLANDLAEFDSLKLQRQQQDGDIDINVIARFNALAVRIDDKSLLHRVANDIHEALKSL